MVLNFVFAGEFEEFVDKSTVEDEINKYVKLKSKNSISHEFSKKESKQV